MIKYDGITLCIYAAFLSAYYVTSSMSQPSLTPCPFQRERERKSMSVCVGVCVCVCVCACACVCVMCLTRIIHHFRCPAMLDAGWNSPCITVCGWYCYCQKMVTIMFSCLRNRLGFIIPQKSFPLDFHWNQSCIFHWDAGWKSAGDAGWI